ncbi:hypothetical protein COX93_00180 [Candidatus Nomurabacteria bacterium CG_4_10_14_0_2_um_filter_30_12]|uniref:Uncharacterized protein n=2 Tax=Candidatus Nomuraibacteriota TaxID=1752729 RepID=A0A2J0MHT8_9BACT|nr:MAG: hypothetical protein COU48_02165 [Candidatus Nomurabacteria bacterium CG10_big_fil_rev_8_21_14_0_10_03_31_7]PIZ87736.1 MAG: hypothetical protein COX93_00180 [Candidatus Nomurabacteria bacterium CG_4_10_14_0_2_um_filter_30_12]
MSCVSKHSYFGGSEIPSFFSEEDRKDLFSKNHRQSSEFLTSSKVEEVEKVSTSNNVDDFLWDEEVSMPRY